MDYCSNSGFQYIGTMPGHEARCMRACKRGQVLCKGLEVASRRLLCTLHCLIYKVFRKCNILLRSFYPVQWFLRAPCVCPITRLRSIRNLIRKLVFNIGNFCFIQYLCSETFQRSIYPPEDDRANCVRHSKRYKLHVRTLLRWLYSRFNSFIC